MINISKKRFPFIVLGKRKNDKYERTDEYFVYDLNRKELGNWLNIWFQGTNAYDDKGNIFREELWAVKKVDEITSRHLYNRRYNPISLNTFCLTGGKFTQKNSENEILYNFKAQIHSIDDSSYGMWWNNVSLKQIAILKRKLMLQLEPIKEVNGDKWFDYGKELGADDFDTN